MFVSRSWCKFDILLYFFYFPLFKNSSFQFHHYHQIPMQWDGLFETLYTYEKATMKIVFLQHAILYIQYISARLNLMKYLDMKYSYIHMYLHTTMLVNNSLPNFGVEKIWKLGQWQFWKEAIAIF